MKKPPQRHTVNGERNRWQQSLVVSTHHLIVCGSLGKGRECLSSSPYYSGTHLLYVMPFVCSFIVSILQAVLQKAPSELKRYSAVISFTCLWFQHFKHWNLLIHEGFIVLQGAEGSLFFCSQKTRTHCVGLFKNFIFVCVVLYCQMGLCLLLTLLSCFSFFLWSFTRLLF